MKIRLFLTAYRIIILTLIFVLSFTTSWGQTTSTYKIGGISNALHASMTPNNRTVGVFLSVGKKNKVSPSEWASTVEKYFKAYGFPVKIILANNRTNGKSARALIYIGAKAYQGNLSGGGVGLNHLLTNHSQVFGELLDLYKIANPDMAFNQN